MLKDPLRRKSSHQRVGCHIMDSVRSLSRLICTSVVPFKESHPGQNTRSSEILHTKAFGRPILGQNFFNGRINLNDYIRKPNFTSKNPSVLQQQSQNQLSQDFGFQVNFLVRMIPNDPSPHAIPGHYSYDMYDQEMLNRKYTYNNWSASALSSLRSAN